MTKRSRLLLLRLDAIGDFVLFTSVLPHVRRAFPNHEITLILRPDVAQLAEHCPYVDGVIPVDQERYADDTSYAAEVAAKVRAKFDVAINAMYTRTWQSDNIVARTRAPVKIGFECADRDGQHDRRRREQVLYTDLVTTKTEWAFELDRYEQLLAKTGIPNCNGELKPELWIQPSERHWIQRFVKSLAATESGYAVLCPGAGFSAKLWSSQSFVAVADWIVSTYGLEVFVVGSTAEAALGQAITGELRRRGHDLTGKLTLRQLAALMEEARLYVGVDTAGFHFAWALGVPTVGIFGGGHFGRFMPALPHVRVVNFPMDCYHCYWHCIFDEVKCITSITPEMVMQQIESVLKGTPRRGGN